jgi:tetratricopeptide (TPR) repeat protein
MEMNIEVSNEEIKSSNEETENTNKLKVPIPVILLLLVILALSMIGMLRFPQVLKDYKVYKTAKERIQNGETADTLFDLYDLAEKYPDSLPIIIRTVEQSLENGYYEQAAYIHDTYMVGKTLSDSLYDWTNMYISWLDKYFNTLEQINIIYEESAVEEIGSYDYDNIRKELNSQLYKEAYNHAVVYYYLAMIDESIDNAIDYLEKGYEIDPNCFDTRVQLGLRYRRNRDFKKARAFANEALSKDKSDPGALRSIAILDLLEGNLEEALVNAEAAYDSYSDGVFVRDTYMIVLFFNGMNEEANIIKSEIVEVSGSIDEDTQELLDGKITLEELYVEG